VNCYSCDQPAINACKRCAKPYCDDHGNPQYCAECLRPSSALPSFNLYRGALLVMLVGTAVAVFLIIRPPGESKGASPVVVGKSTPTVTAAAGSQQPTVQAQTPGAVATTDGTLTPGPPPADATISSDATRAATPEPSGTASPFNEYVVQAGDTLFDIANANLPPGDDPVSFAKAIANLNGLDYDAPVLPIGKKLLLPKPSSP
jgi:LysM repeat protein